MSELLWCFVFLLLKAVTAAYRPHLVTNLPGQPAVNFQHYAGHVALNGSRKSLFYWFYEADNAKASSLPLVLWLSGGPGCSSIGAGALSELGPFQTNDSGTGLQLNPYAWNQVANMIFLESPFEVGFSYSNASYVSGFTDDETASDTVVFLSQWLSMFPEYSKNDFFVTGESYAGHYIPMLATHILDYSKANKTPAINLKGFAIGNPWSAQVYDDPGNVEFLYSHFVIPSRLYRDTNRNCFPQVSDQSACDVNQMTINVLTAEINMYNIYAPFCGQGQAKRKKRRQILAGAYNSCIDSVTPYLNLASVQAALHVEMRPVLWSKCSYEVNAMYSEADIQKSVLTLYPRLFKAKLRIWMYSGDFDAVVSTISTKNCLEKLDLSSRGDWYAWRHSNQVGGWAQVYDELTFATVRGSGHMAPSDQPGPSLEIFTTFLAGDDLEEF